MNRRTFLASVGPGIQLSGLARGYRGYTREYKPLVSDFNIGAVYIPFVGDKIGRCFDNRKPDTGHYDMSDSDVVNRHIDLMQGHGISTLMFNFGEALPDLERFRQYQKADLASEINLEAFWVINRIFQRDLDLDIYLDFMREEMFSRENYNRYKNRPVVQCWGAAFLRWHEPTKNQIEEEYGTLSEFINYVRGRLSKGDRNPYLIAHEPAPSVEPSFAKNFDGYTSWFGPLSRLGQPDWAEFLSAKRKIAERTTNFAASHKKDYIPMAVPGFDDRENSCWGEDRFVPRSPGNLKEMLEFSDKYRTLERVNIGTFNGWPEGHQIEPGILNGENYGTSYLEAVRDHLIKKEADELICESTNTGFCLSK